MIKKTCLTEIQKRLPEGITIHDETSFEFTDDEMISIFSWLKYFRVHVKEVGFQELPFVQLPIISKRLRLDFALYNRPSDQQNELGKHVVYLSPNGQLTNGQVRKNIPLRETINTWKL